MRGDCSVTAAQKEGIVKYPNNATMNNICFISKAYHTKNIVVNNKPQEGFV
jgi:hypothetical protein